MELAPVYFNTTIKTAVGPEYSPNKSFQEVFNRIDYWISERSGPLINAEYVNISIYSPLLGDSYIELPDKFRNV